MVLKKKDPQGDCSSGLDNDERFGGSAHSIVVYPTATVAHSLGVSARRGAAARHDSFQLRNNFLLHVNGGLVRRHLKGDPSNDRW